MLVNTKKLVSGAGFAVAIFATLLGGCSSLRTPAETAGSRPAHEAVATQAETPEHLSLLERRLLRIIEREQALQRRAAGAEDLLEGDLRQEFQRIAREYESVIADNPQELEPLLLYGKFLDMFGDREGARQQFLRAFRIAPETAVVQQQLGVYFAEEGDFGRALAHYLRAIELEPAEPVYHYDLGELLLLFSPGFIQEDIFDPETVDAMMLRAFREAARLEPENLVFQYRLGEIFYEVDATPWEDALRHWNELAERKDLSPMQRDAVRLHQARSLFALDRLDEAEGMAEQVTDDELLRARDGLLEEIRVVEGG